MSSSRSIDEYLQSLQMTMTAGPFQDVDIVRISQLINKTNQFNTTTHRKSVEEVRSITSAPDILTLQVRLSDRFGDNGLISAIIAEPVPELPGTYEIETWVMSCRVFGRQLEYEILNTLVARARQWDIGFLVATYKPTSRNALIKSLFADIGFEPSPSTISGLPGETRWMLDLDAFTDHMTHIETRH